MSERNDGGPAFSIPGGRRWNAAACAWENRPVTPGNLTVRDYFAAKAMQAFLSGHIAHYGHENHWPYDQMASEAFDVADAMLAAREGS